MNTQSSTATKGEMVNAKKHSDTYWFFNKVATVAFCAEVASACCFAVSLIWVEDVAARVSGSLLAVSAIIFVASIILAGMSDQ